MERYETVRKAILQNYEWKAGKVAAYLGLTDELGYEKAVDYVRMVRKKMREDGDLIQPEEKPKYADPEDRLKDVLKLFELRKCNVRKKEAKNMLLTMCYWTMQLKGNYAAVSDTMDMNDRLKRPLPFPEIEEICNIAQEYGFDALDEEKNAAAIADGFPGAGLNWTSSSLYYKFNISDDELPHLNTIGKPIDKTKPWGIPNPQRKEM